MADKKSKGKVFVGGFVDPTLKKQVKLAAKRERRSVNQMIELFLEAGVAHLEQKQAA